MNLPHFMAMHVAVVEVFHSEIHKVCRAPNSPFLSQFPLSLLITLRFNFISHREDHKTTKLHVLDEKDTGRRNQRK